MLQRPSPVLYQVIILMALLRHASSSCLQEKSFAVVAYISQLLNSVLVIILVNARVNARSTDTGERVNEEDVSWLRCDVSLLASWALEMVSRFA